MLFTGRRCKPIALLPGRSSRWCNGLSRPLCTCQCGSPPLPPPWGIPGDSAKMIFKYPGISDWDQYNLGVISDICLTPRYKQISYISRLLFQNSSENCKLWLLFLLPFRKIWRAVWCDFDRGISKYGGNSDKWQKNVSESQGNAPGGVGRDPHWQVHKELEVVVIEWFHTSVLWVETV